MEDNKDVKTEGVTEASEKQETVETYTKEQVDNSFKAGMKKANEELKNSKDYQAFLEWQKTSQSDSEKLAELQTSNDTKDKKIHELETLIKIKDSDVKKEFQKFVSSEVASLVDESTDFDTALKKFKDDNPQYFGETVVKKVQSSPTLNNGGNKAITTNDIMNNILRGARK